MSRVSSVDDFGPGPTAIRLSFARTASGSTYALCSGTSAPSSSGLGGSVISFWIAPMDCGLLDKLGYKTSAALVGVDGASGEVLKSFELRAPSSSVS